MMRESAIKRSGYYRCGSTRRRTTLPRRSACAACGNRVGLRFDLTGQRGWTLGEYAWGDDRDFQCGMSTDGRHHRTAELVPVPADFPVRPLAEGSAEAKAAGRLAGCGTCGRWWDDSIPTTWTPAPSGRCPFENFHGRVTS